MRMYRERADGARISKGWGVGVRVSDRADAGPGVYRDGTGMGFADAIRGGEAEREIGESLAENPYGTCGERACFFFLELTSDAYGHILHAPGAGPARRGRSAIGMCRPQPETPHPYGSSSCILVR